MYRDKNVSMNKMCRQTKRTGRQSVSADRRYLQTESICGHYVPSQSVSARTKRICGQNVSSACRQYCIARQNVAEDRLDGKRYRSEGKLIVVTS
jgi:hypothetical protein